MHNLEGFSITEIPEEKFEKESMNISEGNNINYDDCAKTDEDRLKELKDLKEELTYDDCAKTINTKEEEDIYEDCFKDGNDPVQEEYEEDYEDCRKR